MNIKELAEMAAAADGVAEPKVAKVEAQVRTGVMFPLPDWVDTPVEHPDPRQGKKPE